MTLALAIQPVHHGLSFDAIDVQFARRTAAVRGGYFAAVAGASWLALDPVSVDVVFG